jgi:hypothetical protein
MCRHPFILTPSTEGRTRHYPAPTTRLWRSERLRVQALWPPDQPGATRAVHIWVRPRLVLVMYDYQPKPCPESARDSRRSQHCTDQLRLTRLESPDALFVVGDIFHAL